MKKMFALVAIFALAFGIANAQLSINTAPASNFANSIRNDSTLMSQFITNDPAVLDSFVSGGLTFERIDGLALGSIVVGTGEFGGFYADVSYVGKESVDPDTFGASDDNLGTFGAGGIPLYSTADVSTLATSYHITAQDQYVSLNFWANDGLDGFQGTHFQDDSTYFHWYTAIDVDANLIKFVGRIDDRGTQYIDYQDMLITAETNLNPVSDITPVPEPSTYGLMTGLVLFGAIAIRRRRPVTGNSQQAVA